MPPPPDSPTLSVVIPVFNEQRTLVDLHHRLAQTLKGIGQAYEILFVDDGSRDGSFEVLRALREQDPRVRVVRFNRNYGQHAAVFAGMERARGDVVVTLDADLQNPPEEIPRLLERIDAGVEVVGGSRVSRQDHWFRRSGSWVVNRITSAVVGVRLRDYGSMLRAYRRPVVERILACQEISSFIPALAVSLAGSAEEVPVAHAPRADGRSRYGPLRLLRLNFDLLTGFSLLPIQIVSLSGILVAALGLAFALVLGIRRLLVGPEVEGVFTLFAILFFFVGLQILALGLIGEYVGRIYQEVRRRPRYVISEVLE
jgi:undecaprenyl-phosphate 4-deoxy-4-formamido-L-arabinose transferase